MNRGTWNLATVCWLPNGGSVTTGQTTYDRVSIEKEYRVLDRLPNRDL